MSTYIASSAARLCLGELMRAALAPFIVREEPQHHFALVEYGDGAVDVYLDGDKMMANHVTGKEPWHLLVQGARAADFVIMPVGCPAMMAESLAGIDPGPRREP
jgi:hypothetical protein